MRAMRMVEVTTFRKQSPLELCLEIWLEWQRRSDNGLGWRGRSTMLSGDGSLDSEQVYDGMDNDAAQAVEAMINSLPRHLDWAIRKRCGITMVWRFPTMPFADVLGEAEIELEKKLKNNIATRSFFL
ncbi:hypothetical protein [Janthinobacterium sp.]|uniref:hypothetical protein n=1 Tax=Janthinobacterium sp. TaxID=1871054 RepID=UPI00293D4F59|nr:hypothetical protein [Janthinobacterium sp.]